MLCLEKTKTVKKPVFRWSCHCHYIFKNRKKMKQSCRITCLVSASQPSLPPPVSTADGQQARMAAVSADTEASGRWYKLRPLQINILTLWQLMLASPQCQRCGRGLLPNALVSADGVMIPALALQAWLVCFGVTISKLKQRHKHEPGGHCSVYLSILMG